jgi:O-antigen/teichoic acid export membrane protein
VLIVPLLVLNSWTAVAYLEDRIRELGLATISGALFFLAALLVAQMLGRLTASTAIALWAVSSVLPLVVLLRAARLQVVPNLGAIALALVRFSLRANVVALALVLVWRIDVLLVDWQRGLRELGLYSAAVALAEVLLRIAVSARIALAPQQGSAIGRDLLVMRICRINRLMLAILCVASVVLAIGSTVLVRLAYGLAFVTAAPALVWLLPGVVALILQGPPLDYLVTEGRLRGVTIVTVAALLVNVGLDVLLLPSHGFVVAAVASTVAYILSCGLILVLFARQTGVTFRPLMVVEPRDLALLRAMWGGSRPAPAE